MEKVTKAIETLTENMATEDSLKNTLAEGKPVQRALTAATKKRENSEKKLKNLQNDVTDREAKFALKCPPAPDVALALAV